MKFFARLVLGVLWFWGAALSRAQEGIPGGQDPPGDARVTGAARAPRESPYLLGDWGGIRSSLARRGIQLEPVWTGEVFWNLRGGLETKHARVQRWDWSIYGRLDTGRAGLWDGGEAFLHLQKEAGRTLTPRFTGDYQALSNMEAPDFQQVSELWIRQSFLGEDLQVKAGKMEDSADFGYSRFAQEFLNSSAAVMPHVPMDTFPNQDLGAALFCRFHPRLSLRFGVFQSRPKGGRSPAAAFRELQGPLFLGESAYSYGEPGKEGGFHLGGWWRKDRTPPLARAGGKEEDLDHSYGVYAFWEQDLVKKGDRAGGVGCFLQFTWAPENLDEVARYLGGGLQWTGPLPGRGADVAGIGCFQVRFSAKTGFERHSETALEVFYRFQARPWAWVKPDLQYILSPGGRSRPGALALGIRVGVQF